MYDMAHRNHFAALLLACTALVAADAGATPFWTLELTASDWDEPTFTLNNGSTAGETITGVSISIGDTSYNWDYLVASSGGAAVGATLLSPDLVNNDWFGQSNTLAFSFSDFDAGEAFTFSVDIDSDFDFSFGSNEDARDVLFNNDGFIFSDPNAVVSVDFSDGSTLAYTLPDGPDLGSYLFSPGAAPPAAVPEPGAMLMLGFGLAGLLWMGQARR